MTAKATPANVAKLLRIGAGPDEARRAKILMDEVNAVSFDDYWEMDEGLALDVLRKIDGTVEPRRSPTFWLGAEAEALP